MKEQNASLAKLDQARAALAEAKTLCDVKEIRDTAEAMRVYAKQAKSSLAMQNHCAEIKIRAERRAGEMLAGAGLQGGDRKSKSHDETLILSDLGITKNESHRWQRIAVVPADAFEAHLSENITAGKELTTSSVLKLANQYKPKNGAAEIESTDARVCSDLSELEGQKFGCIYADPPWRYNNQGTRASTDNHYAGDMSIDEICAMPIGELAADKCHLHLWTTNAFLFECPKIFEAWGFEFKSSFVWVKPNMGIGNYWRNSHEIMLLAVRGGQTAISRSEMSWAEVKRGTHSAKPRCVRESVERLSPGPRLELFGRYPVPGWTVYGNQIATDILIP